MKPFDMFRGVRHGMTALATLAAFAIAGCSGGGGGGSTTSTAPQVAKISVVTVADSTANAAVKTSVKTDNSDTVTVVATALDANNVAVPSTALSFSSLTGELQVAAATTDTSGKIIATFRAGTGLENKANRLENITIKSTNGISNFAQVNVTGTVLTASLAQGSSTTVASGSTTALSLLLKDAGGNPIVGQSISLASSGAGSVSFPSASASSDQNGVAKVVVTGQGVGATTATASALGATATVDLTVTPSAAAFSIASPSNNVVMAPNQSQVVTVSAPGANQVTFATSLGTWQENAKSVYVAAVSNGVATATLTSAGVGSASVQAYRTDQPSTSASVTVLYALTNVSNAIVKSLQASPGTVSVSTSQNSNSVSLVAKVTDVSGNPIYQAPVLFSIPPQTNYSPSGETVSPTVAFTDATGTAKSTFTAGTQAQKVKVKASVVGTTVAPGAIPGNADYPDYTAIVDVGGQGVTIGIGQDTAIGSKQDDANYYLAMSVFVTDPQGNPAVGATVNLGVTPIYFSTGASCIQTHTYITENAAEANFLATLSPAQSPSSGGLWTEVNFLTWKATGTTAPDSFVTTIQPTAGFVGSVPQAVTTDSAGKANFTYVYPKSSALWHVVRIQAKTLVAGTEGTTNYSFRLLAPENDYKLGGATPICRIGDSPYGG